VQRFQALVFMLRIWLNIHLTTVVFGTVNNYLCLMYYFFLKLQLFSAYIPCNIIYLHYYRAFFL
jgi:hypothetical protein